MPEPAGISVRSAENISAFLPPNQMETGLVRAVAFTVTVPNSTGLLISWYSLGSIRVSLEISSSGAAVAMSLWSGR